MPLHYCKFASFLVFSILGKIVSVQMFSFQRIFMLLCIILLLYFL